MPLYKVKWPWVPVFARDKEEAQEIASDQSMYSEDVAVEEINKFVLPADSKPIHFARMTNNEI